MNPSELLFAIYYSACALFIFGVCLREKRNPFMIIVMCLISPLYVPVMLGMYYGIDHHNHPGDS